MGLIPSTSAWDESTPTGTEAKSNGDNRIREMKAQEREIIAADHVMESSGQGTDWGFHKQVTLKEQADLGTGAADATLLGSQTVDGKGELVYIDEDDNDIQITKAGNLNIDALTTGALPTDITVASANIVDGTIVDADINASAAIDATKIGDGSVSNAEFQVLGSLTNTVVQVVNITSVTKVDCGNIPNDDTLPQSSEGTECMTLAITPQNASNKLKVDVIAQVDTLSRIGFSALFQDSGTSAIAAGVSAAGSSNPTPNTIAYTYFVVAGSTTARTFKVRCGGGGNNGTFNGDSGNRILGGALMSSITITEYSV